MNSAAAPAASTGRGIRLLAGQAFALGLTMTWTLIPASAIFLAAYGSDLLPVTYIGAAVAGVASSALLASAFHRRPLAAVATTTLATTTAALLVSWIVLSTWHLDWVSFALLVLVPIMVPVGFIFVVGQAGMLLDVRSLKASYARVVAGFAFGCAVGGLTGAPLLELLGPTESLLAVAAAAAAAFLVLVERTRRRYPAELSVIEAVPDASGRPTVRALVRNRYVMLIVAFQMLSAVESQWLDFHVFATAAQRYESDEALARFVSEFTAVAYGTDILFLIVVAGFLLHRFGLRYGLVANSVAVLSLLVAVIAATALTGSGTTIVFVLVVATRVTDLTFSDGTSRTSLSAAYQAVPTRMRALAQATIEGIAFPVAIGISGVVLLLLQGLGGTDGLVVPVMTAVVVTAWVVVAVFLYRAYRVNLLANLRGRTLDPAELLVEEEGLHAVEHLVDSGDERDVRLGLDILTLAEHPELPARLQRLVFDERVAVRTDALERLADAAPPLAAVAARAGLDDQSADVRATSLRVLGTAHRPDDVPAVIACWGDPTPEVRVAAAFAMTRAGDDATRDRVITEINRLARSTLAEDRGLAGRMLGEIDPLTEPDRRLVQELLTDPDVAVVNTTLGALVRPDDPRVLAAITTRLDDRRTAAAAVGALTRAGDAALAVVDAGLDDDARGQRTHDLLVRAAREIGGSGAVAVLRRHVAHPDREVGLAVMAAVASLGPSHPDPAGSDAIDADHALTAPVVRDDLEHATRIVHALVTFEDDPAATTLAAALRDELALVRQRILAAFSMRHGVEGFNRVVFQLTQDGARSHALALEWLDVTLTDTDRAAVAVLEPGRTDRERLNLLVRRFPVERLGRTELLLDMIGDPADRWRRPWIAACALYTASRVGSVDFDGPEKAAAARVSPPDRDPTHIVDETLRELQRRRLDRV